MTQKVTQQREITGVVTSNKMNKTVVVLLQKKAAHPLYGKYVRRDTKFYAHDEKGVCKIGDLVRILHTRPISKTKCWVVDKVILAAQESK
ncbi:MAG: 30S ribosomal protein S17 [Legionellales bacterium]|jgi:small subunit ribosomal protein S17